MDEVGARHPKACITCAKAKVRCFPETEGPCKRCRRLRKECQKQAPGAHRREKKSVASGSDVAALEAKLDPAQKRDHHLRLKRTLLLPMKLKASC
ncbi:transcriptional regulator family: Fungal Specific TF [Penicillium roqueforti]|nr:transcriptional regulator family: Fungal Specific TF [Penicillium roqueforti]